MKTIETVSQDTRSQDTRDPISSTEVPGLVSIGVPVYNGAHIMGRALDALLAQTYPSTEIIISDNGSEDDSLAIAKRYAARYPNIRVFANPSNLGPYANFRIVQQKAVGEFFMWGACDDLWEPTFVSTLVAALVKHPDAVLAQSGFRRRTDTGQDKGEAIYPDVYNLGRFDLALRIALHLTGNYAIMIYGIFRSRYLNQAFPNFRGFRGSDRVFIAEIALASRITAVPEILHTRNARADPKECLRAAVSYIPFLEDGNDRRRSLKPAAAMLLQSKMIPLERKLFVPLGLGAFTLGQYRVELKRLRGWVQRGRARLTGLR